MSPVTQAINTWPSSALNGNAGQRLGITPSSLLFKQQCRLKYLLFFHNHKSCEIHWASAFVGVLDYLSVLICALLIHCFFCFFEHSD